MDRAARIDGLLAVFDRPAAAAELGWRYLEIAPAVERDLDVLLDLVPAPGAAVAETRARLQAEIRRDFTTGDVAAIDGWILARTTLRASAIVALVMAEDRSVARLPTSPSPFTAFASRRVAPSSGAHDCRANRRVHSPGRP
jgi:hypothetical protein